MATAIHVTVLAENTAAEMGLLGEHGLAWWIQTDRGRILFDTGQGLALEHNARQLQIPLERADAVVLSHGHCDHTGGLAALLPRVPGAVVYAHPDVFTPRYSRRPDGTARPVHAEGLDRTAVESGCARLVLTADPAEVLPGIWTTGQVPRSNDFEDTGGPFFLDAQCRRPDPLRDDQAIHFRTPEGEVVLLGCAHAGVVNTLRHVRARTGGRPLHAVYGGMHLLHASPERLDRTIDALDELGVRVIGASHCTGREAVFRLRQHLGPRAVPCHAGTHLEFIAPDP